MSKSISRRGSIFQLSLIVILLLLCLLGFQNCAPQGETVGRTQKSVAALEDTMDFPYEVTFDTIAYTSCNGHDKNMTRIGGSSPFFTFKFMAAESGGIRLTPDFIKQSTGLKAQKKYDALVTSPLATASVPTLSIRPISNLSTIIQDSSVNELNYMSHFFDTLGLSLTSGALLKANGDYVRFVPSRPTNDNPSDKDLLGHRVEAVLKFGKSESESELVRSRLTSSSTGSPRASLIAGFSNSASNLDSLRSNQMKDPSVPDSRAKYYGKSYTVSFDTPLVNGSKRSLTRVLNRVNENNLLNSAPTGSFSCPADLQILMVRLGDATNIVDTGIVGRTWQSVYGSILPSTAYTRQVPCTLQADNSITDPRFRALVPIVRRVFKTEDWFLGVSPAINKLCVVPKRDGGQGDIRSCYTNEPNELITYDLINDPLAPGCKPNYDGNQEFFCPHFASICTRNP